MNASCRITRDTIDPGELLRSVASPADGAVLLFWGIVRSQNDGRAVTGLEYEAYAGMAEHKLREIIREAQSRWPVGEISAVHRVGKLAIGEASVGIAVAAPHRAEVYEASRYIIEELKQRVPIWKREQYVEGPSEWLGGSVPVPEQ